MSWSTVITCKNGVKARKPYRCDLCGDLIVSGARHDTRTGISPDGWSTMRMHPECHVYEQVPGVVDRDWYEDISDAAFSHRQALDHVAASALAVKSPDTASKDLFPGQVVTSGELSTP